MTAAEIIKEIQKLPPEEMLEVKAFVQRTPNAETIEAINEPLDKCRSFATAEELFAELDSED